MNEKYIKILYKLAKKAYKKKEVPVGAIVVKNNKIISKAYNNRQTKSDIIGHAEIICIRKAAKRLHDWRLNECELYTTLEPCDLCKKIIELSRIKTTFYIDKSNYNNNQMNTNYIQIEKNQPMFSHLLRQFFDEQRKNK